MSENGSELFVKVIYENTKRPDNETLGLCWLCKKWKKEVTAWQHICNDCVEKCAEQNMEEYNE